MKKKTIALIMTVSILCNGVVAYADDAFSGWSDMQKEDAWAVYVTTDWKSMKEYLELDSLKSKNEAAGISFRVEGLRDVVKSTLEKMDSKYGIYKNTSYTNMILAMIQVMSGGKPDKNDPCMVCTYINPDIPKKDMTPERSIETLMKRISFCEEKNNGSSNIYIKDNRLLSVVQGAITSPKYTQQNKEYSVQSAKDFIEKNSETLHGNPKATFAEDFAKYYTAVYVGKQYIGTGEATVGQQIADEGMKYIGNPYIYGGNDLYKGIDCSGFVKEVHKICGIKGLPRTSADQRRSGKEVHGLNQALPGDVICYDGHVAIYTGNGNIVHASNPNPYPKGGIKTGKANYRQILSIRRYW